MTARITRQRDIESLKTAGRWSNADRNTLVTLAGRLAAEGADAEGQQYFAELAGARPGEALPLSLDGFFQARLGEDTDAAIAKLDQAAAADDGVIAIDAGTTQDRVKAALGDLDLPADSAISHLILTHAHWDHVGGAGALHGPGTQVIAQAGFPAGLEREQGERPLLRYFTGAAGEIPLAIVPDQLISQSTSLTIGGTELVLLPTTGGETGDALLVHLPASGTLFVGDVLMPYLGQPFTDEGSPEGLLESLAFIASLQPRLLIHGHPTLTDAFTAEAVAGLEAALTQLHGEVLDGIRHGRALPDILAAASLPQVLRDHPAAVVPYLVTRDHFTARLYHQRTGYWQPDRTGLEPSAPAERAAALDLLADGRQERFIAAAATLIEQGDHALALDEIIKPGLLRYPASSALAQLRRTALLRLMERYQLSDPFKFLSYAELADAELGPVG